MTNRSDSLVEKGSKLMEVKDFCQLQRVCDPIKCRNRGLSGVLGYVTEMNSRL